VEVLECLPPTALPAQLQVLLLARWLQRLLQQQRSCCELASAGSILQVSLAWWFGSAC
jgi:hypothetical protein